MNAREEREIILTISPKELRDLADKMEDRFPKKRIGETTFIASLHSSENFSISLHLDQNYFEKLKREGKL